MITTKLFAVADTVIRDAETNNISIITLLDEMTPTNYPFLIGRLTILGVYERLADDPSTCVINYRIEVGDTQLFEQNLESNFEDKLRTRAIMIIGGLPIPKPGRLVVTARLQDTVMGKYEAVLNIPKAPRVETPVQAG